MNILITGAKGFVGRNLCKALKNLKEGKDRTRPNLHIDEIWEYDIDSLPEQLQKWCQKADFVFNLAGVNRPKDQAEFMEGNFGFASTLLDTLKKYNNRCPVMLSSSQQASLTGRFGNSEYGRSKKAGEDLFRDYEREFLNTNDHELTTNSGLRPRVLIYRFPNLFGKWCRPDYNSVVATFCNAFANDLPYTVNDPSVELELLYIDDLLQEMFDALEGKEHRCEFDGLDIITKEQGRYCYCPITHKATLGEIVDLLKSFEAQRTTLVIPEIPEGSFAKKLYSTFLSYLPKEKMAYKPKTNDDYRGSFIEIIKTKSCGQFSINISNPGITRGQHWHNSKWEIFAVVSGHGLIQLRNENPSTGEGKVISFEVSGDDIKAIQMLPGYTHNIINLSDSEPLVTFMWANEQFDPNKPDTYFDPVE